MKRVIKMSKAWIAAFAMGVVLTGCGGGSSDSSAQGGQYGEHSASLSWNAPATRANGEGIKMGELSGYVISYGQNPEELTEAVRIDDANIMEYTIGNLDYGTWYFTIQVEDVDGLVSAPSEQVSKTI
ncbi:fibronectin type III domain-containing protein [Marinobacter sp. TBZ242]|uniref:Fibronectin type III domain-containing protein n=1 Tax=Marinobacter azerbaijanicus TaxID=3050455 RepID=A0ABT7IAS1_9GAMM|nr:fibronectin type III domain-containing protein [Marinobacter sp. TBZ242]MDL0430244.1 fibronectin type III domain-containing protein [Marinobacter sp. TBZ242]